MLGRGGLAAGRELRRRGRELNLGRFDNLELTRTLDHIVAYSEAVL
jgi:hypothetical protein